MFLLQAKFSKTEGTKFSQPSINYLKVEVLEQIHKLTYEAWDLSLCHIVSELVWVIDKNWNYCNMSVLHK